jgi:hypothetical protein
VSGALLVAVACALTAFPSQVARAAQFIQAQVTRAFLSAPPVVVSVTNPLPPAGTDGACGSDAAHQDWEEESTLAVNPTNPYNVAAAWIQDWSDAIVVGYSFDGGGSWRNVVVPSSKCTGGPDKYASYSVIDPSLSFGSDGALYLTSTLKVNGDSNIIVNVSHDGGQTWSQPVVVANESGDTVQTAYVEYDNVLADPTRAGDAYLVMGQGDLATFTITPYFSRTTDGGRTWAEPVSLFGSANYVPPPDQLAFSANLFFVRGDKRTGRREELVCVFVQTSRFQDPFYTHGPSSVLVTRSEDQGATWSQPATVADVADVAYVAIPGAAVAPDGSIYVAWETTNYPVCADGEPNCTSIVYSKSVDGGRTWTPRATVVSVAGAPMFAGNKLLAPPNVAVSSDGVIGVAAYDHRNNKASDYPTGDPPHTTDLWFRYSQDGGLSWSNDVHVAGPFDQQSVPDGRTTPPSGDGFLGDYQGMTPAPGGFVLSFAQGQPRASSPPTDIYFARVRLKR